MTSGCPEAASRLPAILFFVFFLATFLLTNCATKNKSKEKGKKLGKDSMKANEKNAKCLSHPRKQCGCEDASEKNVPGQGQNNADYENVSFKDVPVAPKIPMAPADQTKVAETFDPNYQVS
ncbi:hypothetical protein L596_024842 [Steinernema carpocapsae]|uniref:Uncharacterized protein n=1 Tax=Steinernema carpocapsae TaxID=34508 RepID=A0A4U5M5Z2_STECR|nr:hypothetical protein L596_024842 [Steinernema carpocapsae]